MHNILNCGNAKLSSSNSPEEIGAIAIEINELSRSIENLDLMVKEFEPIIYQYPETLDERKEQDVCYLAGEIRDARKRIEKIYNYLSNHQL